MICHVVSISSGIDSDTTLLLALERCPRNSVIPIFCDTGNEHEAAYEHLAYLEKALDIRVVRLKADFTAEIAAKRMFIARDQRHKRGKNGRKLRWTNKAKRRALAVLHPTGNPFLDLCIWKGRFPSRKAQFCTEELKRNMAVAFQLDLIDAGNRVISWQGVRRDESMNRRNAKKFQRIGPSLWAFRPLVDWKKPECFSYCAERGIHPNPLYKQGMNRVGCMPCINAGKDELREIASRFPEHIARLRDWERRVSDVCKQGFMTFFNKEIHGAVTSPRSIFEIENVDGIIEWAKTTRGGRQYDLLAHAAEPTACASAYGLCG